MYKRKIIESVKKTNRLVVVEEDWPVASISSEISHRVQLHAFDYLDAPVRRVTLADAPFAFAVPFINESLPNVERTIKAVKDVTYTVK